MTTSRILRRREVVEKTGLSPAAIDRKEREGSFPKRLQLGANAVGWFEHEIDTHLANLPRGPIPPEQTAAATAASVAKRKEAA